MKICVLERPFDRLPSPRQVGKHKRGKTIKVNCGWEGLVFCGLNVLSRYAGSFVLLGGT